MQQHENLQLIDCCIASRPTVTACCQLSPILTLFARISKPLWPNILSTGAEAVGGQKTFSSNGCSTLIVSLCATSTQGSESRVRSQVPRPRPRPRLEGSKTKTKIKTLSFKTKTETKTCKNESRNVSRPRLKSRELQVCQLGSLNPTQPMDGPNPCPSLVWEVL